MVMTFHSVDDAKDAARILFNQIKNTTGPGETNFPLSRAYEIVAQQAGFKDWNTLRANLAAAANPGGRGSPPEILNADNSAYPALPGGGQLIGVPKAKWISLYGVFPESQDLPSNRGFGVNGLDSDRAWRTRCGDLYDPKKPVLMKGLSIITECLEAGLSVALTGQMGLGKSTLGQRLAYNVFPGAVVFFTEGGSFTKTTHKPMDVGFYDSFEQFEKILKAAGKPRSPKNDCIIPSRVVFQVGSLHRRSDETVHLIEQVVNGVQECRLKARTWNQANPLKRQIPIHDRVLFVIDGEWGNNRLMSPALTDMIVREGQKNGLCLLRLCQSFKTVEELANYGSAWRLTKPLMGSGDEPVSFLNPTSLFGKSVPKSGS